MVTVQHQDFDLAEEYNRLCEIAVNSGAVVTFVGRVRNFGDQTQVESITLEHYPGMTEKCLEKIIQEAKNKWSIQAVRIIHRVGELLAGEQIVFVGVASSHRGDAFAACEFLMDYLKTQAPFWKKEKTTQGEFWVQQKSTDIDRASRWQEQD